MRPQLLWLLCAWLLCAAPLLSLSFSLAGCEDPSLPTADAGPADAGLPDAGPPPCDGDGARTYDALTFRFRAPCEFVGEAGGGVDSLVGQWEAPGMLLRSDYGMYSNSLTSWDSFEGYMRADLMIDGRPAYLVEGDDPSREDGRIHLIGLHVPEVEAGSPNRLTFIGFADSAAGREALRGALTSVRWDAR